MGFESAGGKSREVTHNKIKTKSAKFDKSPTTKAKTPEVKRSETVTPDKIEPRGINQPKTKLDLTDRQIVSPKIQQKNTLKTRINQGKAIINAGVKSVGNFVEKKVEDVAAGVLKPHTTTSEQTKTQPSQANSIIKSTNVVGSKEQKNASTNTDPQLAKSKSSVTIGMIAKEAHSATNDLLDRVAMMGDLMAIDVQCGSDIATLDGLINDFVTLDQPVFEKTQEKQGFGTKILNAINKGAQRVEAAIGDKLGERATLVSLVTKYPALLANLKHRVADRIAQNNDPHQKKLIRLQTRIMNAEKRLSPDTNQQPSTITSTIDNLGTNQA